MANATSNAHGGKDHGPDSSEHGGGHHPSLGLYIGIWLCLLGLTTLTFFVSRIPAPAIHMPAALLIATTKATLVALFFMHLKYSSGAMRMTMVLSLGFVLLLMAGVLGDIYTRFPLTNSNESELSGVAGRSVKAREAYGPKVPLVPAEHESGSGHGE